MIIRTTLTVNLVEQYKLLELMLLSHRKPPYISFCQLQKNKIVLEAVQNNHDGLVGASCSFV